MDNTVVNLLGSAIKEVSGKFIHTKDEEKLAQQFIEKRKGSEQAFQNLMAIRDEIKKNDDEIGGKKIEWTHYEYTIKKRFFEPAEELISILETFLDSLPFGHSVSQLELVVTNIHTAITRLVAAARQELQRVNESPALSLPPVVIAEDKRERVFELLKKHVPANEENEYPQLYELIFNQLFLGGKINYNGAQNRIGYVFFQLWEGGYISGSITEKEGLARWLVDTFTNLKLGTIKDALHNHDGSCLSEKQRKNYQI